MCSAPMLAALGGWFTWLVNKQGRGLLQVLALLDQDRASADPEAAEMWLGYSTMHMAIYAACAGSYLLDLLHMRCLTRSPMSAQDPDTFLKSCQGRLSCRTKGKYKPHPRRKPPMAFSLQSPALCCDPAVQDLVSQRPSPLQCGIPSILGLSSAVARRVSLQ